jgi:hypothetical protein
MKDAESELRDALFCAPPDDSYHGPAEDALGAYDRKFIRKGVRIEIPLLNRFNARETAEILKGLAQQIAFITRRDDLTERQVLFDVKQAVWIANQKILERRNGKREV